MNKKFDKNFWYVFGTSVGIIVVAVLIVMMIVDLSTTKGLTGQVIKNKDSIKLGLITPLTGDAASFGQAELDATNIAIDEINSKGGVNGRLLQLIPEDGRCNGRDATSAAQKLINIDKVRIILGGACSGETLAIAPISEPSKIILFAAFSSSPKISDAGEYIFRNSPTDNDWAPIMAETLTKQGYKKVAVVTENTDYAMGVRDIFKVKFKELGGTIVADEVYSQGSKDFRTQILKVKDGNPDVIFVNPQDDVSGALLAKQLRELGVNTPFYSAFFLSSPKAIELAGSAVEGATYLDVRDLSTNAGKALIEEYKREKGTPVSEFIIGANYDRVYIIKGALEKCSEDTTCIKNYLYTIKNYEGVIGTYGFKSNGDMDTVFLSMKRIVNGTSIVLE
jgi:branched-chain amino acid transport system substrate-binding protein